MFVRLARTQSGFPPMSSLLIPKSQAAAEPVPDPALWTRKGKAFLKEFKSQLFAAHAEVANSPVVCTLGEYHVSRRRGGFDLQALLRPLAGTRRRVRSRSAHGCERCGANRLRRCVGRSFRPQQDLYECGQRPAHRIAQARRSIQHDRPLSSRWEINPENQKVRRKASARLPGKPTTRSRQARSGHSGWHTRFGNMEVVLSMLLEETVLAFNVLRIPSTSCRDWAAAVSSLTAAVEGELFKSPLTVVKADCAVDRSPELSALPSADRSVAS